MIAGRRHSCRALLVVAYLLLGAIVAPAQGLQAQSRCANCHFANVGSITASHLSEWDLSAHGRNGVGCEACHGGNPRSFEPFVAHREILARANPASPVHRTNEPATCGACHQAPFAAFQRSKHFELLRAGDTSVPNCATCHGEVAGVRPSPKALESQCAQCHGVGKVAPRPEYPLRGRQAFQGLQETRALLKDVRNAISRVKDPARRARYERDARLAEVPISEATETGHAYRYERLDARLSEARTRLAALFDQVANPDSK